MPQHNTPNRRLLVLTLCIATATAFGQKTSWIDYGGGPDNSHFVESKQITKANVGQLDVVWSYPYGQTGFNPLVVDNAMYVIGRGALIALDATTGKEIWIHEGLQGINSRGINYWESKDRKDRRLVFSVNSYLQEVDANTGKTIPAFGKDGAVNLREGLGRDPLRVSKVQSNSPGLDTPDIRYNSGYGLSPNAVKPPWTTVTAYDLNKGTIKWQVPAGDDLALAAQSIHDTGARGMRNGLVPTGTGLVFLVGGDNKVRAYDEDNGKVLWEHDIAGTSLGCPSMYEVDGREYLVITVAAPGAPGRGGRGPAGPIDPKYAKLPSGYVVFALPAAKRN